MWIIISMYVSIVNIYKKFKVAKMHRMHVLYEDLSHVQAIKENSKLTNYEFY